MVTIQLHQQILDYDPTSEEHKDEEEVEFIVSSVGKLLKVSICFRWTIIVHNELTTMRLFKSFLASIKI